jgi:hypothetical protein
MKNVKEPGLAGQKLLLQINSSRKMSFYGPADGDSSGGVGGEKRPRQHTPRGQMSGG